METEEQLFQITCNREQLETIQKACDVLSRLQMGQLEIISEVVKPIEIDDKDFSKFHEFSEGLRLLKPVLGIPRNGNYGIHNSKISNQARTSWDMLQVIRNFLSFYDNPGVTQKNRWEKGFFGVNFDEPFRSDYKNNLIKVKEVKR